MKKILFMLIALCFVTSLALAQDTTQTAATTTATTTTTTTTVATPVVETMMLSGVIIDNTCAGANNIEGNFGAMANL